MADIKLAYGTSNQAITCTLASLANGGARASTVIDNATNKYIDAILSVAVKSNAAGTSATGTVRIYAYGTADGGSTYTEGATGSDAGLTLVVPTNLRLIGVLNVVANATTYRSVFNVAPAFGGSLPDRWGIVVENQSGAALDATENTHQKVYQGVYATSV